MRDNEVFKAVKTQVEFFWVTTLCNVVECQRFEDFAASIFRVKWRKQHGPLRHWYLPQNYTTSQPTRIPIFMAVKTSNLAL